MKLLKFRLPPEGFKRLFYDIETSPNIGFFWSASWKANIPHENIIQERAIICISYKWEGQDAVHTVTWDKGCDKQLITDFMAIAETADELVAHNGDNFDEKWIRTRCLVHGISCPPKLNSFDTLKKARTHFRFNSNRLDYLGQLFFDHGKESIGWADWVAIVLRNDTDALNRMVTYCERDVRLLEDVFHRMQPYVNSNTHAGVATGHGRYSCPACGSEHVKHNGIRYTAAGMPRYRMRCLESQCGKSYTVSSKVYMQKLEDDMAKKKADVQ
jgi:hypothetical protein